MFDRAAWPRVLPFALYMAFVVLNDGLGRLGVDDQQLRWLYAVKIGAVSLALLHYRRRYDELAWPRLPRRCWLLAVAAGALVLLLWIRLNAGWMVVGASAGFDPGGPADIDWPLAAVRLAGAALVVPVMEELFWRSFLLRWLVDPQFLQVSPARVNVRAFLVSVILFGVEHSLWLAGIVAGAVFTLLYMRSRNLWTAIVAHAVTNGLLGVWIIATENWAYW